MNPFRSVWLHPRQTARYLIEEKTTSYALFIVLIGSAFTGVTMNREMMATFDLSYVILMILGLIVSVIIGIMIYYLYITLLYVVGKVFKGTATFEELLKVCSLSYIPTIYLIPLNIVSLFFLPINIDDMSVPGTFEVVLALISSVVGVWAFIIQIGALAEAQRYSYIRAILTLLFPFLMLVIFIVVIILILFAAF